MTETTQKRSKSARRTAHSATVSRIDLARLGDGHVAYIKMLTSDEARRMFPAVDNLPKGINLYALQAADGTPIALTDTRQAAMSHAMDGELAIASVH
jgi:hypothetical protein